MADYTTVRGRTTFYAEATGLSLRAVNDYRWTPVNDWTTSRDRKLGSAIRGLEKLWGDVDVSIEFYVRVARGVLRAIRDFVNDSIDTIEELGVRVAAAIERAFVWFARSLENADKWLDAHPTVKAALELIGSALLFWLGKQLPRGASRA